jgi:hypothetical protein
MFVPKAVVGIDIDCISGLGGLCWSMSDSCCLLGDVSGLIQCRDMAEQSEKHLPCYYQVLGFATAKTRRDGYVLSEN